MSVAGLIEKALRDAKRGLREDYMASQQTRYDLYQGRYRDYVLRMVQQRNPNTYDEFNPIYIDLVRMVVDRRAGGLYRVTPPDRVWTINGEEPAEQVLQRLESWHRGLALATVLDKASRYGELHRTVAVAVCWRHNRVEFDVLPPMHFTPLQGYPDPSALYDCDALIRHSHGRADTVAAVDAIDDQVWTWHPDAPHNVDGVPQWFRLDGNGRVIEQGDNPYVRDDRGAYEWLPPFAVLRAEEPDGSTFYAPGGDDLIDAALHTAYECTDMGRTAAFQSHGQPVFTGTSAQDAAKMILSPSRGMGLTEGADFKYVTPPAGTMADRQRFLSLFLQHLALTYQLPPDTFSGEVKVESGVAQRIRNGPLNTHRAAWAAVLANFEAQLVETARVVHNAHSAKADKLPPADLNVTFPKQVQQLDPSEQTERDDRQIAQGVITPVDIIMREQGMTREQAEERYADNLRIMRQGGVTGFRAAIASVQAEQG